MNPPRDLVVMALLHPQKVAHFDPQEWDLLIRQARRTNLLARLALVLSQNRLMGEVPDYAKPHLLSAAMMVDRQDGALRWEVKCLLTALEGTGVKLALLKGAAYAMAQLPVAGGRSFGDIDLIVPKSRLGDVEAALMIHGWHGNHNDAYDQRYYRRWMHEIPPMRHIRRGTTVDVHHAILPETARVKVNTPALFEGLIAVDGLDNLCVLRPTDMLLHSATHLFHEGDFEKGLRDLFDLDSLLRNFGADPDFWPALVPRANALGLTRPLYYALRFTTLMLDTPVPDAVLQAAVIGRPAWPVAWIMDWCYLRALRPMHKSTSSLGTWPARFALYVRSHWIRMPFHLLAYHLGRKAFVRPETPELEQAMEKPHENTK